MVVSLVALGSHMRRTYEARIHAYEVSRGLRGSLSTANLPRHAWHTDVPLRSHAPRQPQAGTAGHLVLVLVRVDCFAVSFPAEITVLAENAYV